MYEELGIRVKTSDIRKLSVYGEPGRIAAYRDGSIWRMVIVLFGVIFQEKPLFKMSEESRELRFFSRDEIENLDIVVTHSDIVEDWFLNNGLCRE